MVSNPLFIIPDFFCIFLMNFAFFWKMQRKTWGGGRRASFPQKTVVKVNSVQEACAKCFAAHILFEILQIT